ncbi:curli production assembly/transport protein CsgE [Pseudomonas matsuisoli]|jgi:curli production assembly/transport component CsgE|uniref:Curli production assembly/transport component CsgE n=1 Tax=Pseudomonas matsuisoli TaxID=1515666 RepID=A0A917UY33_9PSED|nr:curli production assembly/transport protein CsgE [Pseudomonas matsuisoli]GGJ94165.1 curli production assembly/transport component CsgE [Pseudomonas matsuisoli]
MKGGWLILLALLVMPAKAEEDIIQGLVVDNTITRFGHDFYRHFTARLTDTTQMDFNLVVLERPSARWGSLVWVEYERRVLYRQFLQPNNNQLMDAATAAADIVVENIARRRLEDLLQDNFDMERDEL